jgi:hypothetical protein
MNEFFVGTASARRSTSHRRTVHRVLGNGAAPERSRVVVLWPLARFPWSLKSIEEKASRRLGMVV